MLVIIPATKEHQPVVELSIARLGRRFPGAKFAIITPSPSSFAPMASTNVAIHEDSTYACVDKPRLRELLAPEKRHLVGWYYQQLLKYATVAKVPDQHVLVLDADTVLLKDLPGQPEYFYTSKELNPAYFQHFSELFGSAAVLSKSAVTNFMWFKPDALRQMLTEVEARHGGKWWEIIILIANKISIETAFSEYETYANWYARRNGQYLEEPIQMFRRGDLLLRGEHDHARVVSVVEAKGYDAVAFELNHRGGTLRRLGTRVALQLGFKPW